MYVGLQVTSLHFVWCPYLCKVLSGLLLLLLPPDARLRLRPFTSESDACRLALLLPGHLENRLLTPLLATEGKLLTPAERTNRNPLLLRPAVGSLNCTLALPLAFSLDRDSKSSSLDVFGLALELARWLAPDCRRVDRLAWPSDERLISHNNRCFFVVFFVVVVSLSSCAVLCPRLECCLEERFFFAGNTNTGSLLIECSDAGARDASPTNPMPARCLHKSGKTPDACCATRLRSCE
jgi:hypothetical protein